MSQNESACEKSATSPIEHAKMDLSDDTDGRKCLEWESRYPQQARKEIRCEIAYIIGIFLLSLFFIFATWRGWINRCWLSNLGEHYINVLRRYEYYAFSGLLGGITFGMKYFYRVVARGFWHQDRRPWRTMSPFIALSISIVIGALIDIKMISSPKPIDTAFVVSIGFLSGYFSDKAVGKMAEIANIIFGDSGKKT